MIFLLLFFVFAIEATPLPGWTCSPTWYSSADGCDCHCGIFDPDCNDPSEVLLCGDTCVSNTTQTCSCEVGDSTCTATPKEIPDGWTCPDSYFHSRDGCDCHCGVYDPDCDEPSQILLCGDTCDATTHTCSCEVDDSVCTGIEIEVPPEWTCLPSYFHSQDGCDCHCGIFDPDCSDPSQILLCGDTCDATTHTCSCEVDDSVCTAIEIEVPPEWTCLPSYFHSQDGCDCHCGVYDPDCDEPSQTLLCGDTCVSNATQTCSCEVGDSTCTATPKEIPDGWTCPASYFHTSDGCDCHCGVYDPDCDNPNQMLFCGETCDPSTHACSCRENEIQCTSMEIPDGWTCSKFWYHTQDGCDCHCGVYDPDCDDPTQVLLCGETCDTNTQTCSCGIDEVTCTAE